MTALDWILAAALLFSLLLGAWRGLVYEVLSLLGWVASFYAAQWLAPQAQAWLPAWSSSETARYAAAFVLVLIAALFIAGLLAALVRKGVNAIGLRPVDRALGAAFGVLRGLVLLLAAAAAVNLTALKSSAWWRESSGAGMLTTALESLTSLLPEPLQSILIKSLNSP